MKQILLLLSAIVVFVSCNLEKSIAEKKKELTNISVVNLSGRSNVNSLR